MSRPFILQEIEDLKNRLIALQQTVDESIGDGSVTIVDIQQEIQEIDTRLNNLITQVTTHEARTDNPHGVTKDQVGLNNVDNLKQEPFQMLPYESKTQADPPSSYRPGITHLLTNDTTGWPYGYTGVITYKPHQTTTNTSAYQIGFNYLNERIPLMKVRASRPGSDVWGEWHDYYTTANKPTKTDVGLSNVDNVQQAPLTHVGTGGSAHATATSALAGFMTPEMVTKLAGIAENANNYQHPTGDGNRHVPATGTTNNRRVLMAGPTSDSPTWQQVQFSDLGGTQGVYTTTNKPTRDDVGLGEPTSPKFQGIEVNTLKVGNVELEYNEETKALEFNVTP